MTLYDSLKEAEKGIEYTEGIMKRLGDGVYGLRIKERSLGILEEINGALTVQNEVKRLIKRDAYEDNYLVGRIVSGENPEDIIDGIRYQRKFNLKFNRKKRDEYNNMVDKLSQIIPDTARLKIYSIFNINEPELFSLGMGSFAGGSVGVLGESLKYGIISFIGVSVFLCGVFNLAKKHSIDGYIPLLKEKLKYVNNILKECS